MRSLAMTHPNSRLDLFLKISHTSTSHAREKEHKGQYPVRPLASLCSSCLTSDSHFPPAWFAVNMGTLIFQCT